jgi:predicted dehydrogenase
MTSAILRFPDERLAAFTSSFGAAAIDSYQVVGTEGNLRLDPAYGFSDELKHHLTLKGKTREVKKPELVKAASPHREK